jgi:uncharacterized metal-binding protein
VRYVHILELLVLPASFLLLRAKLLIAFAFVFAGLLFSDALCTYSSCGQRAGALLA